jgi:hypothetical protein
MEGAGSSETAVTINQTARRRIPEDCNLTTQNNGALSNANSLYKNMRYLVVRTIIYFCFLVPRFCCFISLTFTLHFSLPLFICFIFLSLPVRSSGLKVLFIVLN